MNLAELFPEGGRGIIGTADADGVVNLAIFARPQVIDEETVAWGFTEGRSFSNLLVNPHASFMYLAPARGCSGWRLTLKLKEMGEGELLATLKQKTEKAAGAQAGDAIKHVAYFKVEEVRSLD